MEGVVRDSYVNGVRIINNSWNFEGTAYDEKCRQIDEYMLL